MTENNKTEEFFQKLAPCIERGELEACVEEAARVAREMGIGAELLELSEEERRNDKYGFSYVIALAATQGLEGEGKAIAYYIAGLAAQYLRKVEKAEEQYKLAIVANPNLVEAHSNYAILLKELNRKTEAEEHYKLAINANPNYAEAHYNYANLLKELNRKTEAEEQYKLAINANPNYAKAHSNYANLLFELNRKTEAEEQYKLSIAANPNYAAAYSNYAFLLSELNRKIEAEEYYKLAITVDPNLAVSHYNYAILLKELNRKTEAEEQYKLAIAANPNLATSHSNYAILLEELNRKTEAEEQYKLAIAAYPNYAVAHYNYANLLSELNRKTEAEDHYQKAIEANPNLAVAHINYAILLRKEAMFFDAEKEVRIALQIEPKDPYALRTYGDILADEDYLEGAIEKYHEAIRNSDSMEHPEKAEIHNNLGWVYVHLEKYNRAKKEFEEAHKFDPENVKVIRNIRGLHKVKSEPKISKIQWCIAIVLFSGIIATWYLFWTKMLTENVFAAQFIILIAMLIFILFYHQLGKFKAGPIEFEKSTEHRSKPSEAIAKIER
jgi:tetratricopeptide (TPR) repeat protein